MALPSHELSQKERSRRGAGMLTTAVESGRVACVPRGDHVICMHCNAPRVSDPILGFRVTPSKRLPAQAEACQFLSHTKVLQVLFQDLNDVKLKFDIAGLSKSTAAAGCNSLTSRCCPLHLLLTCSHRPGWKACELVPWCCASRDIRSSCIKQTSGIAPYEQASGADAVARVLLRQFLHGTSGNRALQKSLSGYPLPRCQHSGDSSGLTTWRGQHSLHVPPEHDPSLQYQNRAASLPSCCSLVLGDHFMRGFRKI